MHMHMQYVYQICIFIFKSVFDVNISVQYRKMVTDPIYYQILPQSHIDQIFMRCYYY